MFQQVKNLLGEKDETGQYQAKLLVHATVRQVKALEYSKSNGKPKQSLYLQDQHGEQEWVTLQGKFDAMDQSYVGRAFEFLVWPFKAEQSQKIYLYCWLQRASSMAQAAPQTPPQAARATNAPNTARDATGVSIERQCVVKAVCEVVAHHQTMSLAEALQWCQVFHKWVETGKVDLEVSHQSVDGPEWEEDQDPNDGCPV
uniref:Uncharacterized protein n=1 Tax=viral metagenome TaxID=1070528 RepID=A0A6M3XFV8_9ZZZZ